MLNTRLPKLYFTDAAYLLPQYNLQRIGPLSPRGMSGQVQYRIKNFEVRKNFNILASVSWLLVPLYLHLNP
jgi:hypothetical protein